MDKLLTTVPDFAATRKAKVHLVIQNGHPFCGYYAIKFSGHDMVYAKACRLTDCQLQIDKRLREAFETNPSRRTVHAHIVGYLTALNDLPIGGERVRCNPFLFSRFVRAADETTAIAAQTIALHENHTIYANGLKLDPTVDAHCHLHARR